MGIVGLVLTLLLLVILILAAGQIKMKIAIIIKRAGVALLQSNNENLPVQTRE
jgi:hypothetical protein